MAKPKKNDWNDNLSDWKNKAVDAAKVVASRAVVGPLNVVMKNNQVKSVAAETSGINDVKRFKANPSVSNAAMVALSAASYAAPLVKPLYAAKAASAASKAKALPVLPSALTRTMKFEKVSGVPTGLLRSKSANLAVTGFRTAETAKSPARVVASRASYAAGRTIQKGKQTESILGAVNVTNSVRGTGRAMESKIKKK